MIGNVDDFWDAWSKGGLSPVFFGHFVGSGARLHMVFFRPFLVGVGCVFVDVVDEVDAVSAQFIVNSSLAPVFLFHRRIKSVADALKGIRQHGFSPGRWEALHRYWGTVCRQGPCGLVLSLEPWVLLTYMVLYWILLNMVELTGDWPQGLLIAMTPQADGDSTPLGQRPLGVLPVVCRLWASLKLCHRKDWVQGLVPQFVFSLGSGLFSVEACSPLRLILRRSWPGRE